MERNEEYHDPDYAGTAAVAKEEAQLEPEDRIHKIKNIVTREFTRELEERENEVDFINERSVAQR